MRWVIGDIHGMYDSLRGLVEAVRPEARLILVGDPGRVVVIDTLTNGRRAGETTKQRRDTRRPWRFSRSLPVSDRRNPARSASTWSGASPA